MNAGINNQKTHWNTIVIGSGQSGLAAGYFLKKKQTDFVILESENRIGNSWRKRWDSLSLFTPAQYDGLPGMPFPASKDSYPSKDQLADYLEEYSGYYDLPVISQTKINRINWNEGLFNLYDSDKTFSCNRLVLATGTNPVPKVPGFSVNIDSSVYHIHSSAYINETLLPPGDVLVVGAGTSGVEIALELSKSRKTMISGKPTFHIPDPVFKYAGGLYWWFIKNVLTVNTPMGRKAKPRILKGGAPLIRVSVDDLTRAGVKFLPRVSGIQQGFPVLANGTVVRPSVIIWATGYKPDFSWINRGITDDTGWPSNDRGVSTKADDLYFMGMPFQYGLTSGLIGGVGRDAEYIVNKMKL